MDVKKARSRKAENVILNMTRQRQGWAKELDQEVRLHETMLQRSNTSARHHLEKKNVLRVSTTKEELAVMIEGVIVGILHIANNARKKNVKWDRIVRSSTQKQETDLPVLNAKEVKQNHQ